jgi:hypothetical protein
MSQLVKYQQAALNRGGQLLSTSTNGGRKLQWQCQEGHIFNLTGYKVHRRGKWCPQCGCSIGERKIRAFFREFNIPFYPQFRLATLPSRKYDFYFHYNGQNYLVEYDGEQHFRYVRKYHREKSRFIESQIVDRIKTYYAIVSGCHLIRIDYTQTEHIRHHMIMALHCNYALYMSDPQMYHYITKGHITPQDFQKYG